MFISGLSDSYLISGVSYLVSRAVIWLYIPYIPSQVLISGLRTPNLDEGDHIWSQGFTLGLMGSYLVYGAYIGSQGLIPGLRSSYLVSGNSACS